MATGPVASSLTSKTCTVFVESNEAGLGLCLGTYPEDQCGMNCDQRLFSVDIRAAPVLFRSKMSKKPPQIQVE